MESLVYAEKFIKRMGVKGHLAAVALVAQDVII